MSVEELIAALRWEKGQNRALDEELAMLAGFKRVDEEIEDVDGQPVVKSYWVSPVNNKKRDRLPSFTNSIDHAFALAAILVPDNVGGCSWENGNGSARIGDGPYCQAASPALAICIATLTTAFKKEAVNVKSRK